MKQNLKYRMALILIALLVVIPVISAGAAEKEAAKKVAVLPMQMNAAQDLSFLQKGLFSMMSSRLTDPGKVDVIERERIDAAVLDAQKYPETKGAVNEQKARLIGKKLSVDYVMFGSVTMFGNSVSLDTTMVDVHGSKPSLSFSKQAGEPGAVITEMDAIATQVNLKVFNRRPEQFIPVEQFARAPQQAVTQEGSYASPLSQYELMFSTNGEIIGISCADVDNDQKNEIVVAYKRGIEILEINPDGKLVKVKSINDSSHLDILTADAADLNQNGFAEIFITRVQRQTGYLKSRIVELDDSGNIKEIAVDLPWYLRGLVEEGEKSVVFGQESGRMGPFKGNDIFEVFWSGNTYAKGQKLRAPAGFSVISMTAAKRLKNGRVERVFTDRGGRLVMFNESGGVEWSDDASYGGSRLFYEFKETNPHLQDPSEGKGVFLQPKSVLTDLGNDEKPELLVIQNDDAAGNLFGQIRAFKKGKIKVMRWDELGLHSEHADKQIPGQVTDILVCDVDGDGTEEILVSFLKKRNSFNSEKSKSLLIAYKKR